MLKLKAPKNAPYISKALYDYVTIFYNFFLQFPIFTLPKSPIKKLIKKNPRCEATLFILSPLNSIKIGKS